MASGDPTLIADALLRASLSQVDASWVEAASLHSLERPELEVQWAATLALGHLVRRYGRVDLDAVLYQIIMNVAWLTWKERVRKCPTIPAIFLPN